MAMCNKTHKPVRVGSVVRNTGFGSKLMVVVKRKGSAVTLRSFGHTHRGTFYPATHARTITGKLGPCMCGGCKAKCCVGVKGTNTWWVYTHVVPTFSH